MARGPGAIRDPRGWLAVTATIHMPCADTDVATCPLPPAANTLPFAVEAGEKLPVMRGS